MLMVSINKKDKFIGWVSGNYIWVGISKMCTSGDCHLEIVLILEFHGLVHYQSNMD